MSFIDKMRDTNKNDNPYYDEYKKYVNPYIEQYKSYVPPKAIAQAQPSQDLYGYKAPNVLDAIFPAYRAYKAVNNIISDVKRNTANAKEMGTTGKENVIGTAGRVLTSGYEGFLRRAEGIGDAANLGVGVVQKALGFNEAAATSKRVAQKDVAGFITNPLKKELDPYAYQGFKSGQLGDQIGQGGGQILFTVGANKILNVTPQSTGIVAKIKQYSPVFVSSAGSGTVDALNKGASNKNALLYGLGTGAIETGTELISGGQYGMGKGALDDVVVGELTKNIMSPLLKNLATMGIKGAGEGTEEVISGLLTPLLEKWLVDKNTEMYWLDENGKFTLTKAGNDFVVGALTSLIAQSPSNIQSTAVDMNNIKTVKNTNQELTKQGLDIGNENDLIEQVNMFVADDNIQNLYTNRQQAINSLTKNNYTPNQIQATPTQPTQQKQPIQPIQQVEQPKVSVQQQTPKIEKTTPEMDAENDLNSVRDYEEVGKRSVNAYQYENPKVKPYFQEAARNMLADLNTSVKGDKGMIAAPTDRPGDAEWYGIKRTTTEEIAYLLDGKYNYSYDDIKKGLEAIINDKGSENNAVSKRIEFALDNILRGKTKDIYGKDYEVNEEYLTTIEDKPNTIAEEIQKDDDVLTIKDTKPQPKQVVDQRVAQIQETLTPKTTEEKSIIKKLVIKIVDKGYYVDKLARLTKNKELSAKYDTMLVANGVASNLIGGEGFINENGKKIGKSLYETFDPVMEAKKSKEFNDYMYHRLNIDRMSLQDRGYGDNKPVFGETITAEYSRDLVAKYEKSNPKFKTWAEDVYKYNDNLLKRAVDNGILNEESYKYYKEKYPNYVPIRRVDTGTQTGQIEGLNRASIGKPIKVAKGGSQDLIPLKEAMAMNTISMERAGKRNVFANELSKTLGTTLEQQTADIENIIENVDTDSDLLTKGENGNSPTLTYYENGQKNTIAITNEIYDAVETTYIPTIKAINKISDFRRGLITEYNPAFMLTNPIKDIQDGFINTKHPKTFVKNLIESAKQIKSKGKYYQMYIANGGNSNSYFNYKDGFVKQESNSKITYPLRKISEINKIIEMTPRLAEFISSVDAGDSIDTAMYNAAEITTNFKRGGDLAKLANKNGATFLNASIQGSYKQVKNIQQAISNGPRGIAMLAVRFALAGIPFTILNDLLWGDDDEYEQLSDYVKDNYYIIGKYADGKFIRIPKGRVVGVIQKAIDNTREMPTEGLKAWDGFLSQVENSIAPNNPFENNIISPLIQAKTNKAWYGGDLLPMRLKDKAPEDQWDESTDELSKFIGKNLGISPYKVNYVLDQYSGVIGDIGLPAITKEAEQGNGVLGKALSPLVDKFTTDSVLKNQKVSDFYDLTEKFRLAAQKEKASFRTIDNSKSLNRTKKAISDLYKEKREIQLSDLPDKEKYNEAREIQKQINSIANDAIIQYKGKIGE